MTDTEGTDVEDWEPRRVIIDGEEIVVPERYEAVMLDDNDEPMYGEEAQHHNCMLAACSRGWDGCEKESFLDTVPEEYREEAGRFFDIARWDWEQRVA